MKKITSLVVFGLLFSSVFSCACNKNEPTETCIVTFDAVDGYFNKDRTNKKLDIEVNKGDTVKRQLDPTKDGEYFFYKWYSDTGFTTEYDFTAPVEQNIRLYAKYSFVGDEPFYFEIKSHPTTANKSHIIFDCYDEDNCILDFDSIWYCVCGKGRYNDFEVEANWKHYNGIGTKIDNLHLNDRVYIKANQTSWYGVKINSRLEKPSPAFYSTYDVGGNIMSLLSKNDFKDKKDFSNVPNAFDHLFAENINGDFIPNGGSIRNASKLRLPATFLTSECYNRMFYHSKITALPQPLGDGDIVSFAERSCYQMFWHCDSITTIPDNFLKISKVESYAFYQMFAECGDLLSVGDLSVVPEDKKIGDGAFSGMFASCGHLNNVDTLLIGTGDTKIGDYACSSMFSSCYNLELELNISEVLPSTKLGVSCYSSMFSKNLLTELSGTLPATELTYSCYESMFSESSLINIDISELLPATTLAERCYYRMFISNKKLTSVEGVLIAETLMPSCYEGMFYNCTSLNDVDMNLLPATTLATNCYYEMFYSCTSLIHAPELPYAFDTQNKEEWQNWDGCYNFIFRNCTSLEDITVGFSEFPHLQEDPTVELLNYNYTIAWALDTPNILDFYWYGQAGLDNIVHRSIYTISEDCNWEVIHREEPQSKSMINIL